MTEFEKVSVLVVEDEALVRLDLVTLLEQAGYRVFEAGGSEEAITLLERNRSIRVVSTDVRMPGSLDGAALARHVRERWPPTIIVVCSANSENVADIADIHILNKPYPVEELTRVLDAVSEQLEKTSWSS